MNTKARSHEVAVFRAFGLSCSDLVAAIGLALAVGCAAPERAIPTARAIFGGQPYAYGRQEVASGQVEDVIELERAGPRADASILLRLRNGALAVEVLEVGRRKPRSPSLAEAEEAQALLSSKNPVFARGLHAWLARRVDVAGLERALQEEVSARRASAEGFLGDLGEAYRGERARVELREQEARQRNTFFAGLFGWQRGAFSGYSWSFPIHVERYDRSEELRELVLFPFLTGIRTEAGGAEALVVPLLAYGGRVETPVDRTGGFILLGCGRLYRESIAGRTDTTLALPLLALFERARGDDVASDGGALAPGERSSTHLLASLVHFARERPGVYRDKGALKSVGHDRSHWHLLPLISHSSDERGAETILWPLLGFGWGERDGRGYVRLFYFWKI